MQSRPEMLAAQMEDADQYDHLSAKWEYNAAEMQEKIKSLHPLECFFLLEEIALFWERVTNHGEDLDKFIKTLSK